MQKLAPAHHTIHDLLRHRWSPRAFSDKPVSPDILRSLFEAARWAPSSSNEQPWAFLVATRDDPQNHAKMLSTGKPNRNAFYDTGAAVADLSLEATSRGLFVHQMAGFDPQKASELFEIPSSWEPIAAFVIGYPGDPESLPDSLRQRETAPRERKPLASFVMAGSWGKAASFVKD